MSSYRTNAIIEAAADGLTDGWRNRAACAGRSRVMDPPPNWRTETAIESARSVCYGCPVLDECFTWVVSLPQAVDPGGVCAGITESERAHRRLSSKRLSIPPDHKRCGRCREIKPLSEFYRDGRGRDGRQSACKACQLEASTTRYHASKGTRT